MIDARIEELEFLTRVERQGSVTASIVEDGILKSLRTRQMIVHMLHEGYLNGIEHASPTGINLDVMFSNLEAQRWRELEAHHWREIDTVLRKQQVILRISHKGRVRISELRDALTAGKYRDPSGLLWSKRHFERDYTVAILGANAEAPVSLAVCDMNGLKQVNDTYGHDAGDQVIKAYLQSVAVFTGDGIDGYRGDGGDEVYLVLRSTDDADARKLTDSMATKLGGEHVSLSAGVSIEGIKVCCGLVTTGDPLANPGALIEVADKRLYRAKARSKATKSRDSVVIDSDS